VKKSIIIGAAIAATIVLGAASCEDDSVIVDQNLTKAADNFEINRRIVFFNGITDTYLLEVQGRCSITDADGQLEVICKTGDDQYKKHFLGLSDNVSYFSEQIDNVEASAYHYRVTFKPEQIIPSIDLRTSLDS
jgi:hypothetical protein